MFKNNFLRRMIIFCAGLFIVGASAPSMAANILTNGGFEQGDTSGWTISNSGGESYSFDVTSNTASVHSGSYAGGFSSFAGGGTLYVRNSGSVSGLTAGSWLLARVYIKTDNLQFQNSSAGVAVTFVGYGSGGNVITSKNGGVSLKGTKGYTPVDITAQLASGVVTAQIQIAINSQITSGSFYIDEASIESFDSLSARSDLPDWKLVKDSKGTPRLTLNGATKTPVFFFGNNEAPSRSPVIYDEMVKAAASNVNLIQYIMYLPWTNGLSNGVTENVIQASPDAMIFPRIYLHPPQSWITAHPDQIMRTETGGVSPDNNLPSLASDVFFNDCKEQLSLFIRYIQNSPYKDRFMGYHIAYLSGGEWFYGDANVHYYDYSEVNRQKFVQWAQAKYGTINALNSAWNKSYANFDAIQIPSPAELEAGDDGFFRNPSVHRGAADYAYYFNNLTATRLIEIADYIKSLTFNKSLVGFFYGYQLELIGNSGANGLGNGAHMGLRQVLASPNVDILCSPCSYYDRTPGYANGMMSIVDSVTAAGKMYLEEDDSRTWLWPDAGWYLPTEWDTLQCLRRNFGNVIGHNQGIWWMDLGAVGNYNAQSIWDSNKVCIDTYKDSIAHEIPTTPQVALIYDQEFYQWLKSNCYSLTVNNGYLQRSVFQSLGAQVGYYYIQDIPKIPSSVKLYVFVDTFNMDAEKKALIDTIKTNNHTLLWLYAPGYVAENSLSITNMQDVTGFNLAKQSSGGDPVITVVSNSNPICQGIGGHTFGSISGIAPTFYGTGSDGSVVLGNYNASSQPGLMLKEFPTWRSIFCGSPVVSVPLLRSICRYAGAPLLVNPDNMNTADAVAYNGRYLYVYAKSGAGTRTFQVPGDSVNVSDVMAGTVIAHNVNSWTANFVQNEQKIFKLSSLDETPTMTPIPTNTPTPTITPTPTSTPTPTIPPIPNGGFELGNQDWLVSDASHTPNPYPPAIDTANVHAGAKAARVEVGDSQNAQLFFDYRGPLYTSGRVLYVSAWVKTVGGNPSLAVGDWQFDDSGLPHGNGELSRITGGASSWTELRGEIPIVVTPYSSAASLRLLFTTDCASPATGPTTSYWDDINLTAENEGLLPNGDFESLVGSVDVGFEVPFTYRAGGSMSLESTDPHGGNACARQTVAAGNSDQVIIYRYGGPMYVTGKHLEASVWVKTQYGAGGTANSVSLRRHEYTTHEAVTVWNTAIDEREGNLPSWTQLKGDFTVTGGAPQ